jgi:hypothetical protein
MCGCNSILGNETATLADAAPGRDAGKRVREGGTPRDAASDGGASDACPAGDGSRVLACGQPYPKAIALDDSYVYWVNAESSAGAGSVQRLSKAGGAVKTLASAQPSPLDIAVDSTGVYWSINNETTPPAFPGQCLVHSLTPDAGTPACVMQATVRPLRMTVTPSYVVVLSEADVANTRIGGSVKGTLQAYVNIMAEGSSEAVAATDSQVVLGDGNQPHVDELSVNLVLLLGGNTFGTAVCQSTCGNGSVVDIALDTSLGTAYWATSNGDVAYAAYVMPTTMGSLLGSVSGTPQRIAIDALYVYLSVMVTPRSGAIVAISRMGGPPIVLTKLSCAPFGIAVDVDNVYWSCSDQTIQSIPVPTL